VLLDTQCWLWMVADPDRLSRSARGIVASDEHELFLSSASSWEIAIKHGLGKLTLPAPPPEFVPTRMRLTRVLPLPVTHAHACGVTELPWHHRDPFDRLLVAQARIESLSLLTADRQLRPYDVPIVWATGRRR
jgi:PIN domain nuclease of toxin-antitoxin system